MRSPGFVTRDELPLENLKFLLDLVQSSTPSQQEWQSFLQEDDWLALNQLIKSLFSRDFYCSSLSASILALFGNISDVLWFRFAEEDFENILSLICIIRKSLESIKSIAIENYSFGEAETHLYLGEDLCATDAFLQVWFMVLLQILSVTDIFLRLKSFALSNDSQELVLFQNQLEIIMNPDDIVDWLIEEYTVIYRQISKLSPSSYTDIIKSLAFLNWSLSCYSCYLDKIPSMISHFQFEETIGVDISEGILLQVNEVGYPHHEDSSAVPILFLCRNLVSIPKFEGFFYFNDMKILIDTILREIYNLVLDDLDIKKQEHIKKMRCEYLILLDEILKSKVWKRNRGFVYRSRDILELINNLVDEEELLLACDISLLYRDDSTIA